MQVKVNLLSRAFWGAAAVLFAQASFACPDGHSRNSLGWCLPNIGRGGAIDPERVTGELLVEQSAPILKNLILASRNEAFRRGTYQLPAEIMREFSGFFSANVLSVRWGLGGGNDLSLQSNSFKYGDRQAIALGKV